jgi:hypothetical protein
VTMAGMAPAVRPAPGRWPRFWLAWQGMALLLLLVAIGFTLAAGRLTGARLAAYTVLAAALVV